MIFNNTSAILIGREYCYLRKLRIYTKKDIKTVICIN